MDTFLTNPFAISWRKKLAKKEAVSEAVVDEEVNNEPWTDRPEYDKDGMPSE